MALASEARYLRARKVVDRQIRKWGARALLRREGVADRECWAMEVQLTAGDRQKLKSPNNMVYSISAVDLEAGVHKLDALITFAQPEGLVENTPLRQQVPPAPLRAAGIVVYWDVEVAVT